MQKTIVVWLLVAGSLAAALPGRAAQIDVDVGGELPIIKLTGEVDERTPDRLDGALKSVQYLVDQNNAMFEKEVPSLKGQMAGLTGAQLFLNSGGGDVEAAMKAGEIARKYHVTISVPLNASCASACVLLLVGGLSRVVIGRVGIHRPYSAAYSPSLSVSDQRYKTISASVERYLRMMNMPPRLMEAMNAVPPEQIRWLTESEADEFGIGGDDPVWKDRWDSVNAQSRGISKPEYYSRVRRAKEKCGAMIQDATAYGQCYFAIVGSQR